MSTDDSVAADYRSRAAVRESERAACDARTRRIGWARLAVFGLLAVGAYEVVARADRTLWIAAGAVGVAMFVVLVVWHRKHADASRLAEARRRSCIVGAARVERDWESIPPANWTDALSPPQQAVELHVVGSRSLTRLLPALSPVAGRPTMWKWLTAADPPPVMVLRERQTAVRELTPLVDWRERMSVFASRLRGSETSLDGFRAWATSSSPPSARFRWVARALAVSTVVAVVAATKGFLPAGVPTLLLAANLAVTIRARRRLNDVLSQLATGDHRILGLSDVVAEATLPAFEGSGLRALRDRMGGSSSANALRRLEQIVTFGDLRFSPMAHVAAQAFLLWDYHVLDALDAWRSAHGLRVSEWLVALGELESFAALATLAHDNPCWTFPRIDDDGDGVIECTDIAHPILAERVRVGNDVTVGPAGTVLLVTGPNMAGKSTLLRSIGLNVLLAQAGAPVCATRFNMARVRLRTSIHAHDALEDGVSLFMAELLRVKGIVEDARRVGDARVLYIVDEMLRGTNTEERHLGVASVLHHLIAAGAIGVVATHDIELSREPTLADRVHSVHFAAQFSGNGASARVSFDYRLHPGLATGRNAMRLLEIMGLGGLASTHQ